MVLLVAIGSHCIASMSLCWYYPFTGSKASVSCVYSSIDTPLLLLVAAYCNCHILMSLLFFLISPIFCL